MLELDLALRPGQVEQLRDSDPRAWFTQIGFRNTRSPRHPQAAWLERNHASKQDLVGDWVRRVVPGRRVLDAFCANGAFAFRAGLDGATSVTGVDFEPARIEAARLVASFLEGAVPCDFRFEPLDVYHLEDRFTEPFDVVLALGGLYHVADPALVLRQLGGLTTGWLIVQTARVLPLPGNWARFHVHQTDRTGGGLSSIRAGSGVWYYTRACFRRLLWHGGFEVVRERTSLWRGRLASPWYAALARPAGRGAGAGT